MLLPHITRLVYESTIKAIVRGHDALAHSYGPYGMTGPLRGLRQDGWNSINICTLLCLTAIP